MCANHINNARKKQNQHLLSSRNNLRNCKMKTKGNILFLFLLLWLQATECCQAKSGIECALSIRGIPGEDCLDPWGGSCKCLPTAPPVDDPELDLFELLSEGSEYLKNYTDVEEAIIMLGNTGSGKSTAAQIIAADLSRLHAALDSAFNYVIIDEDDKIGLPSRNSKTLLPELVVKPGDGSQSPVSFYDFPGFSDTRGPEIDIAANYFMTEVIKKVSKVKMFFLAPHAAMSLEIRDAFDSLVQHAVDFVADMNSFRRSIALIVTRVPSLDRGGFPDETVMTALVNFLQSFTVSLYGDLGKEEDPNEIENIQKKIAFVETLIQTGTNGSYPHIWFIRSPGKCGPLSEQEVFTLTRDKLTEIYQEMDYTPITCMKDSFGFSIRPESREAVANYTEILNPGISNAVANLTKEFSGVISSFVQNENGNLSQLSSKLKSQKELFTKLNEQLMEIQEPNEFADKLKAFSEEISYKNYKIFEEFMAQQSLYLEFFDKAAGRPQKREVDKWRQPLDSFGDLLSNYTDWYEFCANLLIVVESYDFHAERPAPPNFQQDIDWIDYIEKKHIITVSPQIKILATTLGQEHLFILDNLLRFSLEPLKTSCVTDPQKAVVISGNFLHQKKIEEAINSTTCANAKEIHILAAHTIFFEDDTKLDNLSVAILSPKLSSKNGRIIQIILKGYDGLAYNNIPSRADDGTQHDAAGNGADGCAGRPGGPGGNAFVIVNDIDSMSRFVVDTSGGNGGTGENGGFGGSGHSPDDATCCLQDYCEHNKYHEINDETKFRKWLHYGFSGSNGGRGGNGGAKGSGGLPGQISGLCLNNQGIFEQINNIGADGPLGVGGRGGNGGQASKGYMYFCYGSVNNNCQIWMCNKTEPSHGRTNGNDGQNGVDGNSNSCKQNPTTPNAKPVEWAVILEYRKSFVNHSHPVTTEFIKLIDTSDATQSYFTLKGLAEETLSLELTNRKTTNPSRLESLYSSLVTRLQSYESTHFASATSEHKKIISMLLASSFSSLQSLKSLQGLNMIVDVATYFQITLRQIEKLQAIEDRNRMKATIEEEKLKFHQEINDRIGQAAGYVNDTLNPAMREAEDLIKVKVDQLGEQIQNLVDDLRRSIEEAKSKLREEQEREKEYRQAKAFGLFAELVSKMIPYGNYFDGVIREIQERNSDAPAKVERLEELLRELNRMNRDLLDKQEDFKNNFVPLIDPLIEFFMEASQNLTDGREIHKPELGMAKWEATMKLSESKIALEEVSWDSINNKPLLLAFERVQDTMTLMIEMYEIIDQYQETKGLATYIALMQSATLGPIQITDPEFIHTLAQFDTNLKENLLEQEMKKAMHAFKQWVFPFAKFYIFADTASAQTSTALAPLGSGDSQRAQVQYLQEQLERYKAMVVGDQDTFIFQTNFSSAFRSSKPFFTWNNEGFNGEVRSLLSGQPVNLYADVRTQSSFPGWDAIKFKLIEINLKLVGASNETQEEFDDLLDYFGVSMTHSGVCYYKFRDDYYVMSGSNQTVIYNFERDESGNRLGTNLVYLKFKNGDFLLSPFTSWYIQLKYVGATRKGKKVRNDVGFEALEKFIPFIDIELVGIGTYVDGAKALEAAGGDMMLDKYYRREDRFSIGKKK